MPTGLGKTITVSYYTYTQPVGNWGDPAEVLGGTFTARRQAFSGDVAYRNDQRFSNVRDVVIIDDITSPVADVASLPTISEECAAVLTAPTATDNCVGTITATTTDPTSYSAQGTYMVTWIYSDGNGNSSSQTQTVIIDDITPPTAVCQPVTIDLGGGTVVLDSTLIDGGKL